MAITQDYVSWSTGNDYKGASFVDGAFTVADMTLTKAGAFAASKANHWLYLDDNGSGEVTTGYYRIASVTSADAVVLAASPKAGANDPTDVKCTQHDGTTSLPWRSDQGAVDLLTRNTTDGNQVNISDAAAVVHTAALDLTTFIAGGALAAGAPLIIRGYTSAANDGGIGEIDCNGVTMFAAANYSYVVLADLYVHASINVAMVVLSDYCLVYHCEFYNASGSSDSYVKVDSYGAVMYCYVHGANTGPGISCFMYGLVFGNYIVQGNALSTGIYCGSGSFVTQNVVIASLTTAKGIVASNAAYGVHVIGNILYNTTAGTESGIWIGNATAEWGGVIMNNIVCGFSGVAGNAVENTGDVHLAGHNAFWNNTADYEIADQIHISLTANDVALDADPFTDAANGDFSLTAAGKTALRSLGWPASYLGAHANTDPHITIGPMQYGPTPAAGGGGFPILGGSVVR